MKNYVITIARGYGSGGRAIGQMLAKELNIGFYDRELLKLASDASGIHEGLFAQADETAKSPLLHSIAKKFIRVKLFLLIEMILYPMKISLTIKQRLLKNSHKMNRVSLLVVALILFLKI